MTTSSKPSLSAEAIRQHYAKYGLYVIVDNTRDSVSPEELYRHANAIDDDDPIRAEKLYLACLRKNPRHALARVNLGCIYHRRGDHVAAEAAFTVALSHDYRCAEAHYNVGYLALQRGEGLAALHRLQNAIDIDPSFADAHFNLGLAASLLRRYGEAKKSWERYLELEPNGPFTEQARGYLDGIKHKTGKKKKT